MLSGRKILEMKNRIIKFTLQTAPPYRPFANNNTHTHQNRIEGIAREVGKMGTVRGKRVGL